MASSAAEGERKTRAMKLTPWGFLKGPRGAIQDERMRRMHK